MDPIIIIGAGLAGYNLAREFRKSDTETPLQVITADSGHYYSKPQLSTALTQGKTAESLSMMKVEKMREQLDATILTFTKVTDIDSEKKEITLDNGTTQKYKKLVLAWGAEIIDSKLSGNGVGSVYSINDLIDYQDFRQALEGKQQVTILGSGLIGCEFANDLINVGIKVDVVSLAQTPLEGLLPASASEALTVNLSKKGVTWHWETSIEKVDKLDNGKLQISLSNTEVIESDLVISAIGLRPRTELAKKAGLNVNHGIEVNKFLETSVKDIYALGDCAEVCGHVYQYILPLNYAARALAKTLSGERTAVHYPAMPVSIKTPACPIVVAPPPKNTDGRWKVQEAGGHVKATYIDRLDNVVGFALTGDRIKERMQLTPLLPSVIDPIAKK